MRMSVLGGTVLLFFLSVAAEATPLRATFYSNLFDDCEFIRQAIKALPPVGGLVEIPEGRFDCARPVVIDRDDVTLRGAGEKVSILRLAAHSHAPLLIVGSTTTVQNPEGQYLAGHRVRGITISDLSLDGNRWHQDVSKECGDQTCHDDPFAIRNNGITIRGATDVTVVRVTSFANISGGLVTEKFCDNLNVREFTAYDNFFDGLAGYETVNSEFSNMRLFRNRGAGISIDLNFNRNRILDSLIEDSGDVGIFARHVSENYFGHTKILRSGKHGLFMAKTKGVDTCARDNDFDAIGIHYSEQVGVRMNDDCPGNRIRANSNLCANMAGPFSESASGSLNVENGVACAVKEEGI